jgi:hypothetical protein
MFCIVQGGELCLIYGLSLSSVLYFLSWRVLSVHLLWPNKKMWNTYYCVMHDNSKGRDTVRNRISKYFWIFSVLSYLFWRSLCACVRVHLTFQHFLSLVIVGNNFELFSQNVLAFLVFILLFDWLRGVICRWNLVIGESVTVIRLVWMIAQIRDNGTVKFLIVTKFQFIRTVLP